MTKEEILDELQSIKNYMESKDAYHGYGQMNDLIAKLEAETEASKNLVKPVVSGNFTILPSEKEVIEYIEKELGWKVDGTAETNDMLRLYNWLRQNCGVALPLSFLKWWSGVQVDDKILRAYERWKRESGNDR